MGLIKDIKDIENISYEIIWTVIHEEVEYIFNAYGYLELQHNGDFVLLRFDQLFKEREHEFCELISPNDFCQITTDNVDLKGIYIDYTNAPIIKLI